MPSLLDNLQRRLDDLPVPDILHRPYGHPAQGVAAGLEASPRLRVRAVPPQAQQQAAPAARGPFVRPQRIPSSRQQPYQGQDPSRQPHLAVAPAWNPHVEAQAVHANMPASDAWLEDLPDTPEAPRAASAAQRQAAADVLFEEAAGQSAVADSETVSEDPSWLDDAAAYDAAAAVAEVDDDLSALEILSEDESTPLNGARSQARLNLSHLEHLMLLSDSEEEEGGMSDAGDPGVPDSQVVGGQDGLSQAGRLVDGDAHVLEPHASVRQVSGAKHAEEVQSDCVQQQYVLWTSSHVEFVADSKHNGCIDEAAVAGNPSLHLNCTLQPLQTLVVWCLLQLFTSHLCSQTLRLQPIKT